MKTVNIPYYIKLHIHKAWCHGGFL